jgi:hypothetical protein
MSPQLVITSSESSGSGGIPTGTGTAFIAIATDEGPPVTGPAYVKCQSLTDLTNAFGPRSSTSSTGFDWADDFFGEGGQSGKVLYVTRATDNTATKAVLTLNDGETSAKPTVVVTALTAGTEGNNVYVTVTNGTGSTFTANTASTTTLSNISSFAGLGAGTSITGTGIPANTYIVSVNVSAKTAVLSLSATATGTGVTMTPGTATVTVVAEDSSGDILADETHGPYYTTAQLIADTTSTYVVFSQSAGSGFTDYLPAALSSTAMTGGADASDLTDSSYVTALANFPSQLGPGTVAIPGRATVTCWAGIRDHCNGVGNTGVNRWGVLDLTDASSSAAVNSQVASLSSGDWSRCFFIEGSAIIPPLPGTGGPNRTVPGSATVAALRAQVAQGPSQAIVPAGEKWPLNYALGFTEYFGPVATAGLTAGNFAQSDVNAMEAAGVNCFANFFGTLCLFGFVSPETADPIYDQANAATERMALSNDLLTIMAPYLFDVIDNDTIDALNNDATGVCLSHYNNDALYGSTSASAFAVITEPPVNTPSTAEAGQLNVQVETRFPRYADTVSASIAVFTVTAGLPGSAS